MSPDPLATLDAVMAGLHTLAEIAEETADEGVRQRLTGAVTGLRAAVLTVRDQILRQQEQHQQLLAQARQAGTEPPPRRERAPRTKYGCYQFDDTEGLFCAACFDRQNRRIRTIPHGGTALVCPNCRAVYPYR
jgi:hypothetical protein